MSGSIGVQKEAGLDKSRLSEQDLQDLLTTCTDFVSLCAKLTGRIDPAAMAMLANVMDVLVSGTKSKPQQH